MGIKSWLIVTYRLHILNNTMTPGKKKKTRTRDLSSGKKYEIPHFCRLDLEIFSIGFSDTLNAMV